jgi:hypothetical protein
MVPKKGHLIKNKTASIIIVWCLISVGFIGIMLHSSENISAGSGQDLIITNTYTVSGSETWENVTVKSTGKLVVPTSTTLNAWNMYLEHGSIVEITGGTIILQNTSTASDVSLNGTCDYFNVTKNSILSLKGFNGNNQLNTSRGGNVKFNITVKMGARIENSTVQILGGNGGAYTHHNKSDLGDDPNERFAGCGGNVSFILNHNNSKSIIIYNSIIRIEAGDSKTINSGGGKSENGVDGAPGKDGTPGGNGTDSGSLKGLLGNGGSIDFKVYSQNSNIQNSNIKIISGIGSAQSRNGGSARGGHGGNCDYQNTGGHGADAGKAGSAGNISGSMGCGGDIDFEWDSINLNITQSNLEINSGKGYANAGNGGDAYGGKGGDDWTYSGWPPVLGDGGDGGTAGDGGWLNGNAGLGGNINLLFKNLEYSLFNTNFTIKGGDGFASSGRGGHAYGGKGGMMDPWGGDVCDGGTGGDGGLGGDGDNINGNAGKGGYVYISFLNNNMTLDNSEIKIHSGNSIIGAGGGGTASGGNGGDKSSGGFTSTYGGGDGGVAGTAGSGGSILNSKGKSGYIQLKIKNSYQFNANNTKIEWW